MLFSFFSFSFVMFACFPDKGGKKAESLIPCLYLSPLHLGFGGRQKKWEPLRLNPLFNVRCKFIVGCMNITYLYK